jgi:preprotein translocase subunit SecF
MEFFKKQTSIDFMGFRQWTAVLSSILFFASLLSLAVYGLNWGLDFTGGMQIELAYKEPANLQVIRHSLNDAGFHDAVVQAYGSAQSVLVRIGARKSWSQEVLQTKILVALPDAQVRRIDFIGSQVGRELATKGALAILVALLGTMVYIAMRFEYRFALGAAVALIHDPVIILGIFSYLHIEFNLTTLAAVLAVIGYSLNDTIVIFDRVRENFRKLRKETPLYIMNASINQTLSRTIMTSAMTLVVVLALFLYGGEMIHGFAAALIIGIVVGTYSSIYVAGALTVALGLDRNNLVPNTKKIVDDRP